MEARALTVVVVMFIFSGTCSTCAESDLETDFRVLSKQVTALLDKRREDMKSIEQHVMKAIFDTPELLDLRNEVKKLRSEVQRLNSGKTFPKQQMDKNDVITVKWLYSTVAEVKTEVAEIQNSLNSSAVFQNHERTETQLTLLRSDVANLNAELENERRKNAKNEAELELLNGELRTARENWRGTAVVCGKMKNQLKATQIEWNQNWKILNEKSPSLENEIMSHPSRHQRVIKQHIVRLEKSSKTLHKENYFLKSKLLKMEDEMRILQKKLDWNENVVLLEAKKEENLASTKIQNNLAEQVTNLTKHQKENTVNIENLKGQMSNFDKLHLSMLELLENVETIENKVDKSFPGIPERNFQTGNPTVRSFFGGVALQGGIEKYNRLHESDRFHCIEYAG
ncbi:hypothetical protein JTB14_018635 [Gonioctena quinquepunctata]|nr:hypothetical protein JTB14_018635 [Gonioctena quinquepunctata]